MEVGWSTLSLFIVYTATRAVDVESVRVKVTQGWLEGELLDTVIGDVQYYSFKGIPYAKAPLGNLRFKAPQPPVSWTGVRHAKRHGSVCPQVDINTRVYISGSEDCLFLNVYTPNLKPKTPLPVIFFIHGGAFKSGSGNIDKYGPDFLVYHNVVVITINYRLDALGFLCMDTEEVPGNAGLKDQVAALKWVNKNVKNFGGDANNITIMGQNAGGASVALHLVSPMSTGLFQRVVCMSGVPFNDIAIPYQPQMRPFILGRQLGLDTEDPDKLLIFLRRLPVDKLINTFPSIFTFEEAMKNNRLKMNVFTPVVEKKFGKDNFLTQTWAELARNGMVNKADLFFGHTGQESLFLVDDFAKTYLSLYDRYPEMIVPRKILIKSSADTILEVSKMIREHYFGKRPINLKVIKEFVTYANDVSFIYDILNYLNFLPNPFKCQRYFYICSFVSKRNYYGERGAKYGIRGTSHNDDLLYIFQANALNMTIHKDSREYSLIQLTTKLLTNFVKYSNPTPDDSFGVIWPEYNNITKEYLDGADEVTVKTNPDEAVVEFWNNIYKYADCDHL